MILICALCTLVKDIKKKTKRVENGDDDNDDGDGNGDDEMFMCVCGLLSYCSTSKYTQERLKLFQKCHEKEMRWFLKDKKSGLI